MKAILIIILFSFISGCTDQSTSSSQPQTAMTKQQAKEITDKIFTDYFEEFKIFNPIMGTFLGDKEFNDKFPDPISEESINKQIAFHKKYLTIINTIDPNLLSGQSRLSLEIFKRDREIALKQFDFPEHLIPINQMFGIHNFYAQLGAGSSAQPFDTVKITITSSNVAKDSLNGWIVRLLPCGKV